MLKEIEIYKTIASPSGRIPGNDFIALVSLKGSEVKIECYEPGIKKRLEELFSSPLVKIVPSNRKSGVISHRDLVVQPFTEEFFDEVLFVLHKFDLHGVLKQGQGPYQD